MNKDYQDLLIRVANSKDEAIKALDDTHGHEIVDGKFARAVGTAFGVKVTVGSIRNNPSGFKSPNIVGAEDGEVVHDTIGSMELVTQLCNKLEIDYPSYHGRGSQYDGALKALKNSSLVQIK